MSAAEEIKTYKNIPDVDGLPLLGNTLEMAKDPAALFLRAYRDYGRISGECFRTKTDCDCWSRGCSIYVDKKGRESLRSREFWEPMREFYGASKMLTREDGEFINVLEV